MRTETRKWQSGAEPGALSNEWHGSHHKKMMLTFSSCLRDELNLHKMVQDPFDLLALKPWSIGVISSFRL